MLLGEIGADSSKFTYSQLSNTRNEVLVSFGICVFAEPENRRLIQPKIPGPSPVCNRMEHSDWPALGITALAEGLGISGAHPG